MTVLLEDEVSVHYGFIYLKPANDDPENELIEARGGQANGLVGARLSGVLAMLTGLHTGKVPLRVELHEAAPVLQENWEEIVEAPLTVTESNYLITTFQDGYELEDPPPGSYRVRWYASGMDAARQLDTRLEEEPALDRYLLQLWPAPVAPDAVVKQTSEIAAYWHGVAAETAPPTS